MRLALLEDDPIQAEILADSLTAAGHDTHVFSLGKDLLRQAARETFDAFLLDWMLPDQSGNEVLHQLRFDHGITVPIVFVTSRDSEDDIVAGLDAGADDYVIKPPRPMELLSRLEAVRRRARIRGEQSQWIDVFPYRLDMERRCIHRNGKLIEEVTEKEFALAVFLFKNLGQLVSRNHMLETIWGLNADVPTRTLDTHISRVRRKLDLTPSNGFRLTPIYGCGYRLERLVAAYAS